jgi:uroporphyrinogen-III synthase
VRDEAEGGRAAGSFAGATVVQFESRRSEELAQLIRRQGGVPWLAPAVSEVSVPPGLEASEVIRRFVVGGFDAVVLLTGVGTRRLLEEAEQVGGLAAARLALDSTRTICRGPKPAFVLRQHGVKARHIASEPQTTVELLDLLARLPLAAQRVLIVSAGEQMPEPLAFLQACGADAIEVQLYRWALTTADASRLSIAARELVTGRFDAAVFTTQVQVRHLFQNANQLGGSERLADALRERVMVGAVGPTSAAALRERGVEPDVVPDHPKMGHLIVAMARAMSRASV